MPADNYEVLITVRAEGVDEAAVESAFRYLLAKAQRMPPDHRIEWPTVHVSVTQLPKG